jgi:hypothetical protein
MKIKFISLLIFFSFPFLACAYSDIVMTNAPEIDVSMYSDIPEPRVLLWINFDPVGGEGIFNYNPFGIFDGYDYGYSIYLGYGGDLPKTQKVYVLSGFDPNTYDLSGDCDTPENCENALNSFSIYASGNVTENIGPVFSGTINNIIQSQNGIGTMVSLAANGYENTTGTKLSDDVGFVGNNFIKIIIGSALAVLAGLVNWGVALIIIFAIVYFSYRALKTKYVSK